MELIRAIKDQDAEKVENLLFNKYVDPNAADKNKTTALMYAVRGNPEIVQLLLKAGADINSQDMLGRTALIEAVICRNVMAVQTLVDAGADIWVRDDYQENAAKKAIESQQTQIAKILFNAAFDALYHSSKLA
ncbi:hypothetical protein ASZ90_019960 [hydrocarbon metagenome]|uniref:Uncharacterized protein n=1 Tax=hydrocarbon metagenome TaxID=938273 RepID=A0A0W8E1R3_9ZZZZ